MTGEMTSKSGTDDGRLKIAIQKSGRLSEKSFTILEKAGISLQKSKDQLLCQARNFPLDIFLVRDDDIPAFLVNNVCQLGIIGQNSLLEAQSLEAEVFGGLEQVINEHCGTEPQGASRLLHCCEPGSVAGLPPCIVWRPRCASLKMQILVPAQPKAQ